MRDLAKILGQEIDSLEFRAAWEESSMEYDLYAMYYLLSESV